MLLHCIKAGKLSVELCVIITEADSDSESREEATETVTEEEIQKTDRSTHDPQDL